MIEQINALTILPNSLALWGLGQAGVIVKGPDAIIYIDPYLTDSVGAMTGGKITRVPPIPLDPHTITNADYILSTHEHIDHFDPQTVVPILEASPQAKVVLSGWTIKDAMQAEIDPDRLIVPKDPLTLPATSLRLTAVPAAHYDKDYDAERGYRWLGYLIEWNGVTLFHTGDTIIYDGYIELLQSLPTPDIGLAPINGRDWFREQQNLIGNMMPREAVQLAALLGWDTLIPLHNDMFRSNSVSWTEFASAIETFAPRQRFKRLQSGELYYYVKP